MNSDRATFALRIALSAATAILILAGATLNVSGRVGQGALLAAVTGLLALLAGALNRIWKAAVPLGVAAVAVSVAVWVLSPPFRVTDLVGLLLMGAGGFAGSMAYRSFTEAMRRQLEDMKRLNIQLEEKHRKHLNRVAKPEAGEHPQSAEHARDDPARRRLMADQLRQKNDGAADDQQQVHRAQDVEASQGDFALDGGRSGR